MIWRIDYVSIHAPTWGATEQSTAQQMANEFQSTLPHGERQSQISIQLLMVCFNPRSHMGSDLAYVSDSQRKTFQSTLPHGERPVQPFPKLEISEFQSTLPHGERHIFHNSPFSYV